MNLRPLKILNVHDNAELHLFLDIGIPANYSCRAPEIAVQLLTSFAITYFEPRIEPITSPTPNGGVTCYATVAAVNYPYDQ